MKRIIKNRRRIIFLTLLFLMASIFPALAASDTSDEVFSILDTYTSRVSWDDSVPRLDWKADEASMKLLKITAHGLDANSEWYSDIEGADDIYQSRVSWDDSVPRLDWKANEASIELLQIIAHELDSSGENYSDIEGADDIYRSRVSWDDSVPRLNWKANEACIELLQIIAHEVGADYSAVEGADDIYRSRVSWDDSVPRLNWKANEACIKLLQLIAHKFDTTGTFYTNIEEADDSYNSRVSWDDSVPRLNWKADEAIMLLNSICALNAEDYMAEVSAVKAGAKVKVSAGTVKVLSTGSKTVAFTKAKNKKSVTVPAIVKIKGKKYKVVQINAKAFRGNKIRTITIGKNVKVIKKNAFLGSKATKLILKTKLLKKAKVKGSLRGSKIKSIKMNLGSKSLNKKYVKKYKKIFTKSNAGKKVKIK